MPYKGIIGEVIEVRRSAQELSLEWPIHNFLFLNCELNDSYDSPRFSFWDGCWNLRVYPKWDSGRFCTFLCREDSRTSVKIVNVAFGVKRSNGVEKREERVWKFSNKGAHCFSDCSRSELREQKNTLMPNNVFTIICEMKMTVQDSNARGACTEVDCNLEVLKSSKKRRKCACTEVDCDLEVLKSSKKRRKCGEKALEDFGKGLASGKDSDITVKVGNAEIKVHKFVLSARSPVFEAMLRHDTEEKTSNSIKIEDCEPEDFKHYLEYLYTGSVQSLTEQNVFGLFSIADKYLADDLKQLCLERIRNSLSVQTFCEAVKLALTHGESNLLQLAIDFSNRNLSIIIRTVEWQNFICEYPKEANEILIKCISP